MSYRNRHIRLLAALRYFDTEEGDLRPMDKAPKGTGWGTIYELRDAGLLVQCGEASSIRGRPFRTTEAGRAVLAAPDPAAALPAWKRPEWPEWPDEAETGSEVERDPEAPRLRDVPITPPVPRKSRKGLLVTQSQVKAILAGAKEAGVRLEIRIENGIVRFLPCESKNGSAGSQLDRALKRLL